MVAAPPAQDSSFPRWGWAALVLAVLGGLGYWQRDWLRKILKHLFVKTWLTNLVSPLTAALPPLVAILCDEKSPLVPRAMSLPILSWLNAHPLAKIALLVWPLLLIVLTYWGAKIKENVIEADTVTPKHYGLIIRTLNEVTGHRLSRLSQFISSLRGTNSPSARDYITVLANPEEQINELVWSIYHAFLHDDAGLLSVTLAEMEGKRFERFRFWLPEGHKPNSSKIELSERRCCLSCAATERQLVIVEDIEKELAKKPSKRTFVRGAEGSSTIGSLLAFPVIGQLPNDVPFVISVRSDKRRYFRKSRRSRYEALLEPFALRLATEHNIQVIKQHYEQNTPLS